MQQLNTAITSVISSATHISFNNMLEDDYTPDDTLKGELILAKGEQVINDA
jgi:hypothetical protein